MSALTWMGYVLVLAFWGLSIWREGGLGIGTRFMYGANLFLFFLFGPLLGQVTGRTLNNPRYVQYPIEQAVQLAQLGMVVYVASAYWLLPLLIGRRSLMPVGFAQRVADPLRLRSQHRLAWGFIVVGLLCAPLVRRTQGLPTIGAVLSQTALLVDTGLLMLCLHTAYGGRRWPLLLGAGCYLLKYLMYASLSGHAGTLFINGMVMVCIGLFALRIRIIWIPLLVCTGVLLFIPAAFWLHGRDRLRTAIKEGADTEDKLTETITIFLDPPPLEDLDLVQAYRSRGDFSDLMAAALVHTPAVQPHAWGETYYQTFVAVFPRALWPDKPVSLGGSQYVSRYTGIRFGENTSVGMNYLFEMYVNFGYPGVVAGMVLLGLLLGWMESVYYKRGPTNLFFEAVVVHTGWTICFLTDKLADMVMVVIPGIVLVWTLCRILRSVLGLPARIAVPREQPLSPTRDTHHTAV